MIPRTDQPIGDLFVFGKLGGGKLISRGPTMHRAFMGISIEDKSRPFVTLKLNLVETFKKALMVIVINGEKARPDQSTAQHNTSVRGEVNIQDGRSRGVIEDDHPLGASRRQYLLDASGVHAGTAHPQFFDTVTTFT